MEMNYEFLLETLEKMDISIFVLDAEGKYLYVNNEYCNMLDRTRDFYIGNSITELKNQGYLTYSVWDMVMEKKAPVVSVVTVNDFTNNKIHHFLTTAKPTFNPDGSIRYIYYTQETIENVSKRVQAGILNQHLITDYMINPYHSRKSPNEATAGNAVTGIKDGCLHINLRSIRCR